MPLGDFPLRTQIAVSDIERAAEFYERRLGLVVERRTPSAEIEDGGRVYAAGGGTALIVYQTSATGSASTVATWTVEDTGQVVRELAANGVDFVRYDGLKHDADGVTGRAGGGTIAWFQDPDGNTFAIESTPDPRCRVRAPPHVPRSRASVGEPPLTG